LIKEEVKKIKEARKRQNEEKYGVISRDQEYQKKRKVLTKMSKQIDSSKSSLGR